MPMNRYRPCSTGVPYTVIWESCRYGIQQPLVFMTFFIGGQERPQKPRPEKRR